MNAGSVVVFVYGTLKRGHRRQDLMQQARFIGVASLRQGYSLVDCGGYPGLVPGFFPDNGVSGEIYEVAPAHLAQLDNYEDLQSCEYTRISVQVVDDSGKTWEAQTYLYNRPWQKLPHIGGNWEQERERG